MIPTETETETDTDTDTGPYLLKYVGSVTETDHGVDFLVRNRIEFTSHQVINHTAMDCDECENDEHGRFQAQCVSGAANNGKQLVV